MGSHATGGIRNTTADLKKCLLVGTRRAHAPGNHDYWAPHPFDGLNHMPTAPVSTWTHVVTSGAITARNIPYPGAGCVLRSDPALRAAGKIGPFIGGPDELAG